MRSFCRFLTALLTGLFTWQALAQSSSTSRFGAARFGSSIFGEAPAPVPATQPVILTVLIILIVIIVYLASCQRREPNR